MCGKPLTGTPAKALPENSIRGSRAGRKWTVEQKKEKSDDMKARSAAKKSAQCGEGITLPSDQARPNPVAKMGTLTGVLSVALPTNQSGIISQIPPTDQSIPSTSHEPLESMTDERLDQFVVGHYDGLRKNTLALAEGLSEKKHRLVRKGCESGWGAWVTDTLKMSVSWADKLVRNLDVYHTFGPQVRQAAEEAGVNFAKPAVMAALRVINDEFLANGDPGIIHFSACVQALKIAGMRQQNGQVVPAGAPGKSASEGSGGGPSQAKSEPKDSDHSETESVVSDVGHGKVQDSGNANGLESDPHAEKARRMIDEAKRQLEEAKRRQKELKDSNPVVTVDFTLADVPKDEYARYLDALKRDSKRWHDMLRRAFHEFIGNDPVVESTDKNLEIMPDDDGNA
jgi:hypothetical protein